MLSVSAVLLIPLLVWANIFEPEQRGLLDTRSLFRDALMVLPAFLGAVLQAYPLRKATSLRILHQPGWVLWGSALVIAAFPFLGAQLRPTSIASDASSQPNLLIIGIDTLRADHLATYGYKRPTSPNIDGLAASGVLYENCISPQSSTAAAHASLWTREYPHEHGVLGNGYSLPNSTQTLASDLAVRAFQTAGFVTNRIIDSPKGFGRGFESYAATGAKYIFHRPSFRQAPTMQWWHSLGLVTLFDKLAAGDLVTEAASHYFLLLLH